MRTASEFLAHSSIDRPPETLSFVKVAQFFNLFIAGHDIHLTDDRLCGVREGTSRQLNWSILGENLHRPKELLS